MSARDASFKRAIENALKRVEQTDFIWGQDDCLMWVAAIVKAAISIDIAAPWRGRYTSPSSADVLAGPLGWPALAAKHLSEIGWARVNAGNPARIGDIGILEGAAGAGIGICDGHMWLGRCQLGFSALDGSHLIASWRAP